MGCASSTQVKETPKPTAAAAEQPKTETEEKPKPQIFAIMRNGHEVIRGGMIEVKTALDKDDFDTAKKAWEHLAKFEGMHKTMEEGNGTGASPTGFFKVLDLKADGIVTTEGLYGLHTDLEIYEKAVNKAIKKKDLKALKIAYPKFMEINEAHLKKEEDVMMPSIQKMMKAQEPLKKFMVVDILPTVKGSPDWEFFIKYANTILDKHHGGMPRARVFDHALWAAATPEEWKTWSVWMKESLSEKTYKELEAVLV